jgi:hypothetical protein
MNTSAYSTSTTTTTTTTTNITILELLVKTLYILKMYAVLSRMICSDEALYRQEAVNFSNA